MNAISMLFKWCLINNYFANTKVSTIDKILIKLKLLISKNVLKEYFY